jgi:hypothetical protein
MVIRAGLLEKMTFAKGPMAMSLRIMKSSGEKYIRQKKRKKEKNSSKAPKESTSVC